MMYAGISSFTFINFLTYSKTKINKRIEENRYGGLVMLTPGEVEQGTYWMQPPPRLKSKSRVLRYTFTDVIKKSENISNI